MKNTVLCYIEKDGKYLMLHRTKYKNDGNDGKWIGIGGHFENNESPFDCVIRETKEETGLDIVPRYCGIVTFVSDKYECEQMHLFHTTEFSGDIIECDEGELAWADKTEIKNLEFWQGDYIFLDLMENKKDFFSLKLVYEGDFLKEFYIDGKKGKCIIVSACLLGQPCRYDAKSVPISNEVLKLKEKYSVIPVCPEQLGGLSTPRVPAEIVGERVIRADGGDVTSEYQKGARKTLDIFKKSGAEFAVLKAKSPSCGNKMIYDGTFTRTLKCGQGVCAELLQKNGIDIYNEEELKTIVEKI